MWQTPTPLPPSRRIDRRSEFSDLLVEAALVASMLMLAAVSLGHCTDLIRASDPGQPPISDPGTAPPPRGVNGQ